MFRRLQGQRNALRLLLVLQPWRYPSFRHLSRGLDDLTRTVDRFYELVGDRHWIFHGSLNMSLMAAAVESGNGEEVQAAVLAQYSDAEWMSFAVGQGMRLPGFRLRRQLVDKALADYQSGQYYSVVLVLLSVMDGFVNDVESARRGLHARREEELLAWDSVVGHHSGLAAAHRTFTKSFNRASDEPVAELYRNGIVHGMLTNFDNEVVAAKAWNRLFAVVDWAVSLELGKKLAPPQPTLADLAATLRASVDFKRHASRWSPRARQVATDPEAANEPVVLAATGMFAAWRRQDYGTLAKYLRPVRSGLTSSARAGQVRMDFAASPLEAFEILGMTSESASVALIDARLRIAEREVKSVSRWIYQNDRGDIRAEGQADGTWRCTVSTPSELTAGTE